MTSSRKDRQVHRATNHFRRPSTTSQCIHVKQKTKQLYQTVCLFRDRDVGLYTDLECQTDEARWRVLFWVYVTSIRRA